MKRPDFGWLVEFVQSGGKLEEILERDKAKKRADLYRATQEIMELITKGLA